MIIQANCWESALQLDGWNSAPVRLNVTTPVRQVSLNNAPVSLFTVSSLM